MCSFRREHGQSALQAAPAMQGEGQLSEGRLVSAGPGPQVTGAGASRQLTVALGGLAEHKPLT